METARERFAKIENELVSKARKALEKYNNTPDGEVMDADTILADYYGNGSKVDFHETGLGENVLNQFINDCADRFAYACLFYTLTAHELEQFIDDCNELTTV